MTYDNMTRRGFLAFSGASSIAWKADAAAMQKLNSGAEQYKNPETKVCTFISDLYNDEQKYAVSATDSNATPKPLIVILLPGVYHNLDKTARLCEQCADHIKDAGKSAVIIIPGGRGNGTVFQGYGQIDVFEAIKHVSSLYSIDGNKISVMGGSMGGAATWYMTSHYPDFFSAASPFAGYCDYRLWKKPGGDIFPMREWEEFSWQSRSASDCVENYCNTPLRIFHGEWDRSIGGGVDVVHSRTMAEKFQACGLNFQYFELKGRGHNAFDSNADYFKENLVWLISQNKVSNPARIKLVCHELRYNKNYFIRIEQLEKYGTPGFVDAEVGYNNLLNITTRNIRALSIEPLPKLEKITITIDNQKLESVELRQRNTLMIKNNSSWEISPSETIHAKEKRHGASGPFGDIFYERSAVIYGTNGDEASNHIMREMGNNAVGFYNLWNGGVHRGVIKGEAEIPIPILKDNEVTDKIKQNYNLFLIGTPQNNAVFKEYNARLPIEFKTDELNLGGKTFRGKDVAVIAVFPHPDNPNRYVAILGGVSFDAISWASHLNLALLPDYLVFDRDEVLEWGFFDNNWRI